MPASARVHGLGPARGACWGGGVRAECGRLRDLRHALDGAGALGAWALAWPSVVRIDTREGPSTVLNFVTQYNKTFFAEMAWASVPQVVERDTEPGVFEVFAEIRVDFLNRTAWWPHGGEGDAVENATRVSRAWYHRAQQVLAMDPRARALLLAGRLLWNVQLERVLAQRYPDAELAFLGDDAPARARAGELVLCACAELRRDVPVSGASSRELVLSRRSVERSVSSRLLSGALVPSQGKCPLGTRADDSEQRGVRTCAVCEPLNAAECWQCGGVNALEACEDVGREEFVAVQCTAEGDALRAKDGCVARVCLMVCKAMQCMLEADACFAQVFKCCIKSYIKPIQNLRLLGLGYTVNNCS